MRRAAVMAAALPWLLVACGPAPSSPGEALADKHHCMRCHDMHHRVVGPSFTQVADRYRGDESAPARLAGKIQGGSVGTWGRVIMPRHPQVTSAEARALAQWVLSQPPVPP